MISENQNLDQAQCSARQFTMRRIAALLCFVLLGCGGSSVPERSSPELARQALQTALDAWRDGAPIGELAKRTPPIYFNDPKVESGIGLSSYELEDAAGYFGQSVLLGVKATIKQKNGTLRERKLTYLIDTAAAIVIVPY